MEKKDLEMQNIDYEINDDGVENKKSRRQSRKKSKKKKMTITGKKRKRRSILPVIIIFALLFGVCASVALNVFGVRDKYFYPIIRKIPIVGGLIPYTAEDKNMEQPKEELIGKIKALEEDYIKLEKSYDDLQERFNDRGEEITRLAEFEKHQEEFKKDKEELDGIIASGETKKFVDYYETIYPENADRFYKEAVVSIVADKQTKKLINTYSEMDEGTAADILEELMTTDINLVVEIIKNVDTQTSANILAEMTVDNAATITRRLAPQD